MKTRISLLTISLAALVILFSCSSGGNKSASEKNEATPDAGNAAAADNSSAADSASSNPKGVGKFTDVKLTHPLDQAMITAGKAVYDVKCASCHKLTDEKLVGPGWKGVTDRRKPEWIMNFVTNTEEMLAKDVEARNLYEICLVKMPNQNLSDDDARHMLEFMRNNDGKK